LEIIGGKIMRFVLYVSRLPRNLRLLFVERVFVGANGLVSDAPEQGIAYKTRFAGFMRLSHWFKPNKNMNKNENKLTTQNLEKMPDANTSQSEFAKRRQEAIRSQMLHGGLR
jgi:hypothetical protein